MAIDQHLLAAILEEYKTLRAEVVAAIDRQYSLTNWGVSAIALLMGALVSSWDKMRQHPNAVAMAIGLALPAIVTSYAAAWVNVNVKITSIGAYLYLIEEKLARCFEDAAIREMFHVRQVR